MSGVDKLIDLPEVFPPAIDKFLGAPSVLTLIVIFQGCFGGMGVIQTPDILKKAINSPIARFLFLSAIAYTATADLEVALFTTVVFLILMHMLRTKEEKDKLNGKYF